MDGYGNLHGDMSGMSSGWPPRLPQGQVLPTDAGTIQGRSANDAVSRAMWVDYTADSPAIHPAEEWTADTVTPYPKRLGTAFPGRLPTPADMDFTPPPFGDTAALGDSLGKPPPAVAGVWDQGETW